MATMTKTRTSFRRFRSRRVEITALSLTAVGAMLTATACSSDVDGTATTETVVAPGKAPPSTPEPPPATTVEPTSPTGPPPGPPNPPEPAPPTTTRPASPTTAAPDPVRQAQLGEILAVHHAAGEFVGARIALLQPDGTVTEATAGTPALDPASGPVDPDVPWNIGSATKAFVAVVVLQLAEEGRVDLDAGIDGYLPDLPGAERITPRQLLHHTSGLGEYLHQPAVSTTPCGSGRRPS